MKNLRIAAISLLGMLLLVSQVSFAQTPVSIVDPGELMSGYNISKEVQKELLDYVEFDELAEIIAHGTEDGWPEGIDELDERLSKAEDMKRYTVYEIATLEDGDTKVLKIPASENAKMPYGMAPSTDIYFFIGASGVGKKGLSPSKIGSVLSGGSSSGSSKPSGGAVGAYKINKQRVRIVNSGQLYSTYNYETDDDAMAAVEGAIPASEIDNFLEKVHEDAWPSGISTLDAWEINRDAMNNYVCYYVAEFGERVILWVPASENRSMPTNLRPTYDIYFTIGMDGTDYTGGGASSSNAINGNLPAPYKNNKVVVQITNSGQLYSTYNLEGDEDAMEALRDAAGGNVNYILKYANEDMWPEGISTLSAWERNRTAMEAYKTYKVAEFGEKIIIWVPKSENQSMPTDLRPDQDIYMVIGKSGVSVKGSGFSGGSGTKFDAQTTNFNFTPVRIVDTGPLYSTFDLGSKTQFHSEIKKTVTQKALDKIITYSAEGNWPSGISTFSARELVRPDMKNYVAYRVAQFDGNSKAVLWIPAAKNKHMTGTMKPTEDFYFIIENKGYELK